MKTSLLRKIRNNFFTGLIVIFPLIITFLLVRFLLNKINNIILEPSARFFIPFLPQGYLVFVFKILAFICVILIISLFGLVTKNIFGKRLIAFFEGIILKLPFVGKIYSGTKEISNSLLISDKGSFRKVVLVEFPQEGSYCLGFITSQVKGEIQDRTEEEMINVFVPTTPNPTSGFLLFVPKNKLTVLDMPVEDGIKLVISFGMISPLRRALPQT